MKSIVNTSWTVKSLIDRLNKNEILKPKFQRKRKWIKLPDNKNENIPCEKKYIEFLFEYKNSIHPITFGKMNNSTYNNIDGNNRINAIYNFLDKPFEIFEDYLDEIYKFIDKTFPCQDIKIQIKEKFKEFSYDYLMKFKYKNFKIIFNETFYNNYLIKIEDDFDKLIEDLQSKLKIDDKLFENEVCINVNIFENYELHELCTIFENINKYNSRLTETELLASKLFDNYNFIIDNKEFEIKIKKYINKYYLENKDKEICKCYTFDNESKINLFDLMIGLQNYGFEKTNLIDNFNNVGLQIIYKIWKIIYKDIDKSFIYENINNFIKNYKEAIDILQEIKNKIFNDFFNKIIENNKKDYILKFLKKNLIYCIIVSIIGFLNQQKYNKEIIIKAVEKNIIYNIFIKELNNKDKKHSLKNDNKNKFGYIKKGQNEFYMNKIYKNPEILINNINYDDFENIFKLLIEENIKPIPYILKENGRKKIEKRRPRKIFELIILSYYYNFKFPKEIKDNYKDLSYDHIIAFISNYKDFEIDIDRLGNLIPNTKEIRNKRITKPITIYKSIDFEEYQMFIKYIDLIPTDDINNKIINYDGKKTEIINYKEYNKLCEKNENIYINLFTNYLFSTS